MKFTKPPVAKMSNSFIRARFSLSTIGMRIIYSCFAQVAKGDKIDHERTYYVDTSTLLELGMSKGVSFKELKTAAAELMSAHLTLSTLDAKKFLIKTEWFNFVQYAVAEENEGRIGIRFTPVIVPMIENLCQDFTKFKLCEVKGLKGYALRLYPMFAQFADTGKLFIGVQELRDRLDLAAKYEGFGRLKDKVLLPAIKKINESEDANFRVEMETSKIGNTVDSLTFSIVKKKPSGEKTVVRGVMTPKQAGLFAAKLVSNNYASDREKAKVQTVFLHLELKRKFPDIPSFTDHKNKVEAWYRNGFMTNPYLVAACKEPLKKLGFRG